MSLTTVFMGTPEIAVPTLRALAARTTVTCVVTQPDRPAGRGQQKQPPPVKVAALELGLPVWQPETLKGQATAPQLADADLFVVLAYGELLRQDILDLPRGACINLHASLLPRWRGASPLQAVLRAGDAETGVTVMRMVRGLDAGPMFLHERLPLTAHSTLPDLHDAIAALSAVVLGRFLDRWPSLDAVPQDEAQVTLCRKLLPEDGHLDFTKTMVDLERWVRAYTPAPGCWALADGERMRVLEFAPRPLIRDLSPGTVRVVDGELLVGCGDGACAIGRLQPAGKRAMMAADFLRGHRPPAHLA
ncbi:MAG: methionyl-tRNA formyltransferase [Planctomycetes bacterium]|jgi:methionyl-tRNA formyltransferase|nr:methionyl-tRNA formyltransferase [Planctomycetota bacterium]